MIPKKILAIKLRSLGDTVLMSAPLSTLHANFPRAKIDVVVTSQWAPLLENHPAIHKLWHYHRYQNKAARAKSIASLALNLRKFPFDCAVNFHASPSSAILAFSSGAKMRSIHFHGHTDKNKFSTVEISGKGQLKPIIERDMDTIRAIGAKSEPNQLPKIYLKESEILEAKETLAQTQLPPPYLGIALGASRPTKIWPITNFIEVSKNWKKQTGGSIILLGIDDEKELTSHFSKAFKKDELHTFLDLPIRKLCAVISKLNVLIGNDSGPRHIAVAVDTPTITLIGPEHPLEWHPYPVDRHPFFYIENLNCRKDAHPGMPQWCSLYTCEKENHKCMKLIGSEPVTKKLMEIYKK